MLFIYTDSYGEIVPYISTITQELFSPRYNQRDGGCSLYPGIIGGLEREAGI